MRLGKVQACGYVADVTEDDATREPQTQTQAPAAPEPVASERGQVSVPG